MRFFFWWGSGRSTPIVAHHEVVDADMTLQQGLDQDCAITRVVAVDLAIQQTLGEDVER